MFGSLAQLAQFNEPDLLFEYMPAEEPGLHTPGFPVEPIATPDPGAGALLGATIILVPLLFLIILLLAGLWKTFKKAGVGGWKAIIPFYNLWVLFKIAGKPGWWSLFPWAAVALLLTLLATSPAPRFTPLAFFLFTSAIISAFVGRVLWDIMGIDLSRAFGKSTAFGVLWFTYLPIGPILIGFGKAQYVGPAGQSQGPFQAPPQAPLRPPQAPTQTSFQAPPQVPTAQVPPPQAPTPLQPQIQPQDPLQGPPQTPPQTRPPQTPMSW